MTNRKPAKPELQRLKALFETEWHEGYTLAYKSLKLRKISWHRRDHREYAVVQDAVLLDVVDLDEWLSTAREDPQIAAAQLGVMLEEAHQYRPKNADQWSEHWSEVRERSEIFD